MTESALVYIAAEFWNAADGESRKLRDLCAVVSQLLPLSVVKIPRLSLTAIEKWFESRQAPYSFLCNDRTIRGCLVAARGRGIIFLDSEDSANERRFTVAHEIAHFLVDYEEPRRVALSVFGEAIRPVLDGVRAPTVEERINSVLSSTPIGVFYNLVPRSALGDADYGSIFLAEDRADRLALELLAPADEVLACLPGHDLRHFGRARQLYDLLISNYGLPPSIARTYAVALLPKATQKSMSEWFGL